MGGQSRVMREAESVGFTNEGIQTILEVWNNWPVEQMTIADVAAFLTTEWNSSKPAAKKPAVARKPIAKKPAAKKPSKKKPKWDDDDTTSSEDDDPDDEK